MKRSEFYRNFSLGLVYPAVLGTLIFQLIEFSNNTSSEGELYSLKVTVLMFLVIIYSLDYLKNSLERYTLTKVVFDFITVFGLYFSYSSLDLSNDTSINLIRLSFAYYILTGLENTWVMAKDIFSKQNSRNDELTKRKFEINRTANLLSFICAGTFMFGPLKLAKLEDYYSWSLWFIIVSSFIIVSEIIRVLKLVRLLTNKD
jgi:hypothetical protein